MRSETSRRVRRAIALGLISIWSLFLPRCDGKSTEADTCVDVSSFQAMARDAECAELRNRLFMIDRHLVFWDAESDCPDRYWNRVLFGCTVDDWLCRDWATVGGGMRQYADSSYKGLFETILANRDRRDLGLGPRHEVIPIPF